jgi:DNA-binding transcriptional regulator YdaS (Cro superfamily)
VENIKILTDFYGSQKEWADAWGVSEPAVSQWVAAGDVPVKRLLKIEALTGGVFIALLDGGKITLVRKSKKSNKEG